jgi:hypothetical protein
MPSDVNATNLPSATPAPTNDRYKMSSSCSSSTCGCPANYVRITDEISCGRAAAAMGKNFRGLSARKPAPSGCFNFDDGTGTSSIEFTVGAPTWKVPEDWKDPEGMPIQKYSLLCATGAPLATAALHEARHLIPTRALSLAPSSIGRWTLRRFLQRQPLHVLFLSLSNSF